MSEQQSQPHLSIVIPAYNEEKRLPPSLQTILEYMAGRDYSWDIVIVDDGSSDGTSALAAEILRGVEHTILRNDPNEGKARSVRRGLLESRGKVALFTDSDLSTPIDEAEKLLGAIADGADVAIASRQLRGSVIEVHQPWYREFAGRAFGTFNRLLLGHGIQDTQCGFKAFTREAIEAITPHQQLFGWAFDAEMMLIARRLGLRIDQLPVRWIDAPGTKVNMFVDGPKMVMDLLRIRWLHRGLRPGTGAGNGGGC